MPIYVATLLAATVLRAVLLESSRSFRRMELGMSPTLIAVCFGGQDSRTDSDTLGTGVHGRETMIHGRGRFDV